MTCGECVFLSKNNDNLCMCLALAQPMRSDSDVLCEGEYHQDRDNKLSREEDLVRGFEKLKP